jgi:hypothetical protein
MSTDRKQPSDANEQVEDLQEQSEASSDAEGSVKGGFNPQPEPPLFRKPRFGMPLNDSLGG